jgi:hypothetical protein
MDFDKTASDFRSAQRAGDWRLCKDLMYPAFHEGIYDLLSSLLTPLHITGPQSTDLYLRFLRKLGFASTK